MSTETAPIPMADQQQVQKVVDLAKEYENFEIATVEDCQYAANILVDLKKNCKALESRRKEITKPMDDAKKSVMALFKPATDALTAVEKMLKPRIAKFQQEQEAKQRQLEAEAREKARKEREKLEARAEKAREKGQVEKADALEEKAMTTVAQTPVAAPTKVSGVSTRKRWVAEVTDVQAVCRGIANGDIPASILEFKQAELNKFASTWQSNKQFDGLNIYQDSIVSTR